MIQRRTVSKSYAPINEPEAFERFAPKIQATLKSAQQKGASGAEAGISIERGLSVAARMGEVETIEHHLSRGFGITVYFGLRKGSASSSDLSEKALEETVEAACRIARLAAEDPAQGLPDQAHLATEFPALDLYHPWGVTPDEAIQAAITAEAAALAVHPDLRNSEGSEVSSFEGYRMLGNSHGFLHGYASSRHSLSVSVIGEREGEMQRDDWWTCARNALDLETADTVGRIAGERTLRRLGSRNLGSRRCPVIFAADVASSLLGHFIGAIRGGNLYRKSSFLLDHLGKEVFPAFIDLREDPHLPRALGSAPYDAEGVRTQGRALVEKGVLKSYVLSSYSARRLGLATTGNAGGVHNLTISPGTEDLKGLLRQMGTGLYITDLMGQGVNLVTGDYSRGASGFWVEGGEMLYPVEEITIAGNLRSMFKEMVAVGKDVDLRGNTRTGSILMDQMTVAGN